MAIQRQPQSPSFLEHSNQAHEMNYTCPPPVCKISPNKPSFRLSTTVIASSSSSSSSGSQIQKNPRTRSLKVDFRTLRGCKLGISRYPDFEYNAEGGRGTGSATTMAESETDGEVSVIFDVKSIYIPPLTSSTTKFLGLPLPPFLKIDIEPELLKGKINQDSGEVGLEFKAKFMFSIGGLYRAPPLMVETELTSEEARGNSKSGRGERMNQEGECRLVGVALVEPINDFLLNSFLSLPSECIAVLNAAVAVRADNT